ncbi:MAG: AEC family transporter [Campylobacteraceae bacterium]|nr:AEC family transporter [Campylobacteraceae bacterium]
MIFEPIWTVFFVLFAGYMAKVLKIMKAEDNKYLLDFVIYFALPSLIFSSIYYLDFKLNLVVITLLGGFSTLFAGYIASLVGKFLNFSQKTRASMFIMAGFGNTLFVGIPVITGVLGDEYLGKIIIYDAFTGGSLISLVAPFVLKQNESFKKTLKNVFTFPPLLALFLALVCKLITIPEFMFKPLNLLGSATISVALFSMGLKLSFDAIKNSYKPTAIVLFCKMILSPAILVLLLQIFAIQMDGDALVGIFQASMPPMVVAAALVIRAGYDSDLATSSVAFGLLGCLITVPFLSYILLS